MIKNNTARPTHKEKKIKFVDLFAGLGGFHVALQKEGHECIYACELDPRLRSLYSKNFNLKKDYIWDDVKTIPKMHLDYMKKNADMICAGFPCQPFSKAGTQNGFNHTVAGDMFNYLFSIIKYVRPEYIFLENVPNLFSHASGVTYKTMKLNLEKIGYSVNEKILAPIHFYYPQTRERLYIVGIHKTKNKKYNEFIFPKRKMSLSKNFNEKKIKNYISKKPKNVTYLPIHKVEKIEMWQDLLNRLKKKYGSKKISYEFFSPLWLMEFGANYPIEQSNSFNKNLKNFIGYKGAFSKKINLKDGEILNLPQYAQTKKIFPEWKRKFIKRSRDFTNKYHSELKTWIDDYKVSKLFPSYQKFEWNAHGENLNLKEKLISFRPSGIRVTRSNVAPTLIAMTTTQTPIIGNGSNKLEKKYRFITFEEALKLQGFAISDLPHRDQFRSYFLPAIGNAINVKVVNKIIKKLV